MSGVREVRDQNGESVVYKSDSEMGRALAAAYSEIAALQRRTPHTILLRTLKGT